MCDAGRRLAAGLIARLPRIAGASRSRMGNSRPVRWLVLIALHVSIANAETREGEAFGFAAGHVGLGTPLGATGVEAGVGFAFVRASAGVGIGFRGLELMAGMRAVIPLSRRQSSELGLVLGGFISRGPSLNELDVGWHDANDPPGSVQYGNRTVWFSGDLGLLISLRMGLELGVYAGLGHAIVRDCVIDLDGHTQPCSGEDFMRLGDVPYFGTSVGYRFAL